MRDSVLFILPMKKLGFVLFLFMQVLWIQVSAQWKPAFSPERENPPAFWISGLTLHLTPEKTLENYAVQIRNGKFERIIPDKELRDTNNVLQLPGLHMYPSFIHLNEQIPAASRSRTGNPVYEGTRDPYVFHWNDAIRPDRHAFQQAEIQKREEMLSAGFGMGLVQVADGVVRGTASLISYGEHPWHSGILLPRAAAAFSLRKGGSQMVYPSSEAGAVALFRQLMYDLEWYEKYGKKEQENEVLNALLEQKKLPWLFVTGNKWSLIRMARLAEAWKQKIIHLGAGDEYQRIDQLRALKPHIILPLDFPEAYDVSDPLRAAELDWTQLKHWELAPSNPARCIAAGIPVALACTRKPEKFWDALRKAAFAGADTTELLRALTNNPAEWLGISTEVGSIAEGHQAFAFITQAPIFGKEKPEVLAHITLGKIHWLQPLLTTSGFVPVDVRGQWKSVHASWDFVKNKTLEIKGSFVSPKGRFYLTDTTHFPVEISLNGTTAGFHFFSQGLTGSVHMNLSAKNAGTLTGMGYDHKGDWFQITFEKIKPYTPESWDTSADERHLFNPFYVSVAAPYPFHPAGFHPDSMPVARNFVIRKATVWTGEKDGILSEADVWVQNGKIRAVGKDLKVTTGVQEINGKDMHLTAGIIDEHAHIALRNGVNETGKSVTSEVRMQDVINPDDPAIYHQLGGGVTAAQLLHGSANVIGGQAVLIKLRWGASADEMIFDGAMPFIKFALGENVKQSNWGEAFTNRYPQTRMGVEAMFRDAFRRAKAYAQSRNRPDFRRNLSLDALVEILENKRQITCHSYVRNEILMLMQVAEEMGFKINTFTHILEGYKVAEEMRKHGASGSTFSDWWAYKMEVMDAIPYNAAMMHRAGVRAALNSDDASMGRRLNHQAAKAVKYGGVSEIEAWNMVTLYPAQMLHVDNRVGSIRVGKDADLVLWTGNPMHLRSRVVYTWVDGILRFSRERDLRVHEAAAREKKRILAKMADLAARGEKVRPVTPIEVKHYHCESFEHGIEE